MSFRGDQGRRDGGRQAGQGREGHAGGGQDAHPDSLAIPMAGAQPIQWHGPEQSAPYPILSQLRHLAPAPAFVPSAIPRV